MTSPLSRPGLRPATSPSPRPELDTVAGILARRAENPSAFTIRDFRTRPAADWRVEYQRELKNRSISDVSATVLCALTVGRNEYQTLRRLRFKPAPAKSILGWGAF